MEENEGLERDEVLREVLRFDHKLKDENQEEKKLRPNVEDILKATKTVLHQKRDSAKAFDSFLEKRKSAQSIASPLSTREEVHGDNVAKKNASDLGNLQELPNHSRSF
ncbi:unnamed protein product [Fraxinus pennsylvanica]|uniref:Uncharacterized protein n=1 Tax=Fraxinus pennsylvanica TaxID=56036 RepID=A0AAD1YL47_9LAMI|nr:unnamed protein product [Fraxinus pennsylvanica]